MSEADRRRWNSRYAAGAYQDRTHPSTLLARWLPRLLPSLESPSGAPVRALDVACGAGRNSLYLAAAGLQVTGVDIADAALRRARDDAERAQLSIDWVAADLEQGRSALDRAVTGAGYGLILVVRYVNLALLPALCGLLQPQGYLLLEQHLITAANVGGPRSERFRVAPGVLRAQCSELQCVASEEGLFIDPDGAPMALSTLVARRRD